MLASFGFQGEVDHHDGVFLYDPDQKDNSNQSDHAQVQVKELQGEDSADARRGQRGENGQRMNVTFVQDSQHNVHGYHSGEEQPRFVRQRIAESGGRTLETRRDARRHADFAAHVFDILNGIAEGSSRSEVKGDGGRGELTLVIERERGGVGFEMGERAEGYLFPGIGLDVETAERVRALAEFGRHFQDYVVLVDLRKHDGDEALAKSVI